MLKGSENACAQKQSSSRAVVIVSDPDIGNCLEIAITQEKEDLIKTSDEQIHIIFIHHDHNNPVKFLSLKGCIQNL